MRVDHFVVKPPKKNTYNNNTGANMANNALTTPSITKSMGFAPSESVWIETQKRNASIQVWGRIQSTGVNYIVEGYREHGDLEWVRIPCRRLQDAQLLLSTVMSKKEFALHRELKDITNGI